MKHLRTCALAAALLAIQIQGAPAEADETRAEFWPEAQLHLGLDPQTKIILLGNISRSRETRSNLEGQLGINVDYRFDDMFSVRAGYRFATSLVRDDPYTEHRFLFEQTFRFQLPWSLLLSLRTREDLRFIDGKFSARFRERATIERNVEIGGYTFTPYGSAEAFYDTRYDTFSRYRFALGAVFPVNKNISLDASVVRQTDLKSSTRHVNAVGLTLVLSY